MAVSSDQIAQLYRQYLGRDANPDEIQNWQNGTYGATDLAGITGQIQQSGEAQDYARNNPQAGSGGSGGGSGGGVGGSLFPAYAPYVAPTPAALPNAPSFTAPAPFSYKDYVAPQTFTPPAAFSYQDFKAPTSAEAQQNPGYQFGLQQGLGAMQNSAAAKGLLHTGGTVKGLNDYANQFATQNYQQVYNNAANQYATNFNTAQQGYNSRYQTALDQYNLPNATALSAYNTNFNTAKAAYQSQYQSALDEFAPKEQGYLTGTQATLTQNQNNAANSWAAYSGQNQLDLQRRQGVLSGLEWAAQ